MKLTQIAIALVLTATPLVLAQDWPQDYLDAHNAARYEVGLGPLSWDSNVAAYAQNYANSRAGDCALVHSGGPYGENLAWSGGGLSGFEAVQLWVNERPYYDYYSDTCTLGQQCRHYTQVVWRNSDRVGCAKVTCGYGLGTFITCNYYPPVLLVYDLEKHRIGWTYYNCSSSIQVKGGASSYKSCEFAQSVSF